MYIGNAMQGEVAAVFAQLYIDGESKGECRDPSRIQLMGSYSKSCKNNCCSCMHNNDLIRSLI